MDASDGLIVCETPPNGRQPRGSRKHPNPIKSLPRRETHRDRLIDVGEGAFAPRLVLMVKEPRAGLVKTRLGRGVGVVRATSFYRNSMQSLVARLASQSQWRTYLAVAPDASVYNSVWPEDVPRFAQGSGDLGQRMQRIMDGLPAGPVVIVGTDCPGLMPHHIRQAFRALGDHDAVLGPASDGGYWLIGLKRRPSAPQAFTAVRWSGPDALCDTLGNLKSHRVAMLHTMDDVDVAEDLPRAKNIEGRRVPPFRVRRPTL